MWHGYEDNDDQDGHHDHDNDDHHHRDDQDFIEHLECGLEVTIGIIPRQGPTRSLLVIPDHCHLHHHHGDHAHDHYDHGDHDNHCKGPTQSLLDPHVHEIRFRDMSN